MSDHSTREPGKGCYYSFVGFMILFAFVIGMILTFIFIAVIRAVI